MCRNHSASSCDDLFSSSGKRMCLAYELQWRFALIEDVNHFSPDELLINAKLWNKIRLNLVASEEDSWRKVATEDKRWWSTFHHVEAAHLHARNVLRWQEKKEFDFDSVWHKVGGRNTRASIQTCCDERPLGSMCKATLSDCNLCDCHHLFKNIMWK